jgi:hypothetical protein
MKRFVKDDAIGYQFQIGNIYIRVGRVFVLLWRNNDWTKKQFEIHKTETQWSIRFRWWKIAITTKTKLKRAGTLGLVA